MDHSCSSLFGEGVAPGTPTVLCACGRKFADEQWERAVDAYTLHVVEFIRSDPEESAVHAVNPDLCRSCLEPDDDCVCEEPAPDFCAQSEREGSKHSWVFDGDDPYVVCTFCEEYRDAISGRVVKPSPYRATPRPPRESGQVS